MRFLVLLCGLFVSNIVVSLACDTADCSKAILPTTNQVIAVANGNWNTPGTWSTGAVPLAGQNVVIPAGFTVLMNAQMAATAAPIRSLLINGTLNFPVAVNSSLVVDTIVVDTSGVLNIGTSASKIAANIKAKIIFSGGDINAVTDPQLKSRGLLSHGTVNIYGANKTSYVKVAGTNSVTGVTLTLANAPTGWRVGDQLLITGSEMVTYPADYKLNQPFTINSADEERTITAISGTTLTLNSALTTGKHNRPHAGMPIYVANLTRNVEFSSATANVGLIHRRGHTMFMTSPNVNINNAAFIDLGRTAKDIPVTALAANGLVPGSSPQVIIADSHTNHLSNMRGRYPVHFHKIGQAQTTAINFNNNVIRRSPGWGIALHSSYGNITNNVSYDIFGSHFVAEDGDERGSFVGNLAVKSVGDTIDDPQSHTVNDANASPKILSSNERTLPKGHVSYDNHYNSSGVVTQVEKIQDDGQSGIGFWFQSRNLTVNNNVAISHPVIGMTFFHRHIDQNLTIPTSNLLTPNRDAIALKVKYSNNSAIPTTVDRGQVPLTVVNNNTVVASNRALTIIKGQAQQGHNVRNIVTGTKAYNVAQGIEIQYSGQYTFRDTEIYCFQPITCGNTDVGVTHGPSVLDVAYVGLKISGWTKPMNTMHEFDGVLNPPAILVVNGQIKRNNTDSQYIAFNPALDLYEGGSNIAGNLYIDPRTPTQPDVIHQISPYNTSMDLNSSYTPPVPLLDPLIVTVGPNWSGNTPESNSANMWLYGIRTDAAGVAADDRELNVYSFSSQWPVPVLRARANEKVNNIFINRSQIAGKYYLNVIDHVTDRTTGKITSFPVAIELKNPVSNPTLKDLVNDPL